MSNLIPFQFNTSSVRVVTTDDGEILFVASDIAKALCYANPQKAVRDHCKKALPVGVNESFSLDKQTVVIPESDVYRLISRSKLESAERFQDWVFEEVLPTIRKTGAYSATEEKPKQNRTNDIAKTAKTYKAFLAMAKLSGLSGNQALLAADSATKKIENHSPLALLGVDLISDVKEKTITPSDIGNQIGGLSPQKVNKLLMEQGYQINLRDLHGNVYWQPTDKGKPFGEMIDTQKNSSDGSPVKQWRWYLSIVDQLSSNNSPVNGLVVLEGAA